MNKKTLIKIIFIFVLLSGFGLFIAKNASVILENAKIQEESQASIDEAASEAGEKYGIGDIVFEKYKDEYSDITIYFVSDSFENLPNKDKLSLISDLEKEINRIKFPESSVYYDEEIRIEIGDYRKVGSDLVKGLYQVYPDPDSSSSGYNSGSSSNSSRKKCSSCNGSGKKLVEFYEYGDWGEVSYSTYTCTSCNGTGYD